MKKQASPISINRVRVDASTQDTRVIDKEDAPLAVNVVGPQGPCKYDSVKLNLPNNVLATFAPLSNEPRWHLASENPDFLRLGNEDDAPHAGIKAIA